ncbi:hypothetical protein DFH09DRAFT_1468141 [Mycena vulgaris]|nr:hypothetical protein DFH09DRAFT_1468141 [Mycena vulgaris]
MHFSLVIAALLLPSYLASALSQNSSLVADCGTDAYAVLNDAVITGEFNTCVDFCGDSVIAATQTALAAYNTTAGNAPTTDPTDHTFLLWAEGNAPDYNSAMNDCATAVQTLRTALINLPESESDADEDPAWPLGLPSTDGFPPFTVPSATKGSGSASSIGLDDGGGSPKPTGPASPTQSGHKNGAYRNFSPSSASNLKILRDLIIISREALAGHISADIARERRRSGVKSKIPRDRALISCEALAGRIAADLARERIAAGGAR